MKVLEVIRNSKKHSTCAWDIKLIHKKHLKTWEEGKVSISSSCICPGGGCTICKELDKSEFIMLSPELKRLNNI